MPPSETSTRLSHDAFILGCENAELGCSVMLLSTLQMLATGEIRDRKLRAAFARWSASLVCILICLGIAFIYLPIFWPVLGSVVSLGAFAVVFNHRFSDAVIDTAIAAEDFYELAVSRHILWVSADDQ